MMTMEIVHLYPHWGQNAAQEAQIYQQSAITYAPPQAQNLVQE